jgi:hypothetical protein
MGLREGCCVRGRDIEELNRLLGKLLEAIERRLGIL